MQSSQRALRPRAPAPATGISPAESAALFGAGGLAAVLLSALLFLFGHSLAAAAVPLAALGTAIAVRWPQLAIGGLLAAIGFELSLTAYAHLHIAGMVDGAILVLWLAAAWLIVTRRDQRPVWVWPGLLALCLYPLVSLPAVFTADSISLGLTSWKLSSWHLLAFAAVAVAPWPPGTYRRVARMIVLVAFAVAAYSALRKFTGPSASELIVGRANARGLPYHLPVPYFGSLFTAQDLATWCCVMIPFCTSMALLWRGRWKAMATLAATLTGFVLLEADRRAAFVAAVVGTLVVLALYSISARAFGGRRLAITLAALGVAVAIGGGVYTLTIARSPQSQARFSGLFSSPTHQRSFEIRQSRWAVALDAADRHPLGVGLGHAGALVAQRRTASDLDVLNLDSSYVKIAYEQGFPVLAIFILGLATLLSTLAIAATRTAIPERAALGIGACGTLSAMAVVFYTSLFIESLPAVAGWVITGVGAAQFCKLPAPATSTVARRRQRPMLAQPARGQ